MVILSATEEMPAKKNPCGNKNPRINGAPSALPSLVIQASRFSVLNESRDLSSLASRYLVRSADTWNAHVPFIFLIRAWEARRESAGS
jgi:hypothetical protein